MPDIISRIRLGQTPYDIRDTQAARASDLALKQDALTAGNGIAIDNSDIIRTTGIPFGTCDSTSTSKVFTATVPGIYKLEDGVCCIIKNGVVTSESGFTLNVNGLGAKPSYSNMATGNDVTPTDPTRDTTIFNINYAMLFVYSSTIVDGGGWICYRGYDANTNTIGYQLRHNSSTLSASDKFYRYRLLFTSADGTKYVPANTSSSTNGTASRTVNLRPIDPFGEIVYYSSTSAVNAGANPAATVLWDEYVLNLGYSFNRTGAALVLTYPKPVYIKCAPQTDGSAIIDEDTPYVQTMPSTNDGKIYIFLGIAYSATNIELIPNHPVYYHDGTGIRLWTGEAIDNPVYPVQLSVDANNNQITSDKTYDEILAAVLANKEVIATVSATISENFQLAQSYRFSSYVSASGLNVLAFSALGTSLDASSISVLGVSKNDNNNTVWSRGDIILPKGVEINETHYDTDYVSGYINLSNALATVATSGSYNDLTNKPTIPTSADINAAKPLVVTMTYTQNGDNVTYSADETFATMKAAYLANREIFVVAPSDSQSGDGFTMRLMSYGNDITEILTFSSTVKFFDSVVLLQATCNNFDHWGFSATQIPPVDSSITGSDQTNPVQGGAIYSALLGKQNKSIEMYAAYETLLSTLTGTSYENPVTLTGTALEQFNDLVNKYTDGSYSFLFLGTPLVTDSETYVNIGAMTFYILYGGNSLTNSISSFTINKQGDNYWVENTSRSIQAQLVSGTNIKTINNQSLLGSGNLTANDIGAATISDVNTAVSNLVDSAPATLNTLNELATALGNDPNFATTVTNKIAALQVHVGSVAGKLYRNDVNGGGNFTVRGNSGCIPNLTAGTFLVSIYAKSATQSYTFRFNFGSSVTYDLSTTNGEISDVRQITIPSNGTFSGSVLNSSVASGTILYVVMYNYLTPVSTVGVAAVTNQYNDLDNIPNGTLTIQKNGTTVGTFTANQSSNTTANITVPTTASDVGAVPTGIATTYANLVTARTNSQLKEDAWYRITDYACTTTQTDTQSAGHQFDILVQATSPNTLNEEAKAIRHEGDTYFVNSNFEAWKVWYCLDNDTTRFAWADSTNGKGIIYRMIDEWGNDCPYDFKNIQFKRDLTDGELDTENGTTTWVYTFNLWDTAQELYFDASIIGNALKNDEGFVNGVYNNKMGIVNSYAPYYGSGSSKTNFVLSNNVFLTKGEDLDYYGCRDNTLGSDCFSNTFGEGCSNNTFGNKCFSNAFGNNCCSNTFKDACYSNTFGNECSSLTFGDGCFANTFKDYCTYNTFGNGCHSNTFGDNCSSNTFGNSCRYNTFGNGCHSITFGNNCTNNTFSKPYTQNVIVENGNKKITLTSTQTPTSGNPLRNITIAEGVNNTNTVKTISHNTLNDTFRTTYTTDVNGNIYAITPDKYSEWDKSYIPLYIQISGTTATFKDINNNSVANSTVYSWLNDSNAHVVLYDNASTRIYYNYWCEGGTDEYNFYSLSSNGIYHIYLSYSNGNFSVTLTDDWFVSANRKINNKYLVSDITLTASDVGADVFVVNIESDSNDGYTCDKTNAEIYAAWQAGRNILLVRNSDYIYNISTLPSLTYCVFSGVDYDDPSIISNYAISTYNNVQRVTEYYANFQEILVSGTNIKTINNLSLLGSGNLTLSQLGIPVKISDLSDDKGILTEEDISVLTLGSGTLDINVGSNVYTVDLNHTHQLYIDSVSSSSSGIVVFGKGNGDTITLDLSHSHPQYLTTHQSLSGYAKYVLCADETEYNAILNKDSSTLYLIPESNV